MVGGRRFRPSVAVVNGRRFRPTFGHLECISMSHCDWYSNKLATTRTESCGAESVLECKSVFLRIDGCCCVNVHVRTSFFRRETRPVVLVDEKHQSVFLRCHHADALFLVLERQSVFLSCKTVEHRSRKSRDLLQTDEFMVTHLLFVVTALSVVACVLLHAHPSLRMAQGGHCLSFGRCV